MRWPIWVLALALATGCADGATIQGTIFLTDPGAFAPGQPCEGEGGYGDIGPGMQVQVRDANGTVLGAGRLGRGEAEGRGQCTFEFTVVDLPERDLYILEAGRRGTLTYSREELEDQDWRVTLNVGE